MIEPNRQSEPPLSTKSAVHAKNCLTKQAKPVENLQSTSESHQSKTSSLLHVKLNLRQLMQPDGFEEFRSLELKARSELASWGSKIIHAALTLMPSSTKLQTEDQIWHMFNQRMQAIMLALSQNLEKIPGSVYGFLA